MINKATTHTTAALKRIEINVDCGEAFGLWECGPDEDLMPMIDVANVACGGHAGDPVVMRRTIAACKKHGIKVGARECGRSLLPFEKGAPCGQCDWSSEEKLSSPIFLPSDPGFPDKAGFGRRVLDMSSEQAYAEMWVGN